ncbi:hypothetical protein V5O48_011986 [Marasmius crinis-equi]|uniref:Synembryn-A n=1 Tax=Marasmius crinis-equi TaxID=585013 RepID=A0ABR3F405_9AGAR
MLGRHPEGSEYLASEAGLSTLLSIATSLKEKDLNAFSEALKCIANAMLLFENGRSALISEEVKGGEICVRLLKDATTSDEIFIISRILFFATVSPSPFIIQLVEEEHEGQSISDIVSAKMEVALAKFLKNTKATMGQEAIADLLKFSFNLLLRYPKMVDCEPQSSAIPEFSSDETKIMGDFWSPKLDGFLSPILKLYLSLPPPGTEPTPLQAPLTSAIHALITIPVNDSLRSQWFKTTAEGQTDVVEHTKTLLSKTLKYYFPGQESPDAESIRAFAKSKHPQDALDDDLPALDNVLAPLIILATRLCIGDASARSRICSFMVPDDLDRDPARPLDERASTLGRCLRLMGSVYFRRLKECVGEMLWAMCGQDAGELCSKVGYGHVAGFLFEKGVTSAPAPPDASDASASSTTTATISEVRDVEDPDVDGGGGGGTDENPNRVGEGETEMTFAGPSETRQINPITGTYVPENRSNPMDDMDEEEKEREMEKLFVLFDRMEKIGALSPDQNPVRKAMQKSMQG